MQNILKRPMFRKGGLSTTNRMNYSTGTTDPEDQSYTTEKTDPIADAKELMEFENIKRDPFAPFDMSEEKETVKKQFQRRGQEELMRDTMAKMGIIDQLYKPKKDRRIPNLALRFGDNLANRDLRGSFLSKVAQAGSKAALGLIDETAAMDDEEAGINSLKMKRFMDLYDREELRDYKQSQAEDGIDDQETAFMKNVGFASEVLYPGRNFAELAEEEQRKVTAFLNKDVRSDAEKQNEYLSGIYKVSTNPPKLSDFGDEFAAYADAVTEYENKTRNKLRSQKIHGDLLSSGKIDGIDITTVAIADTAQKIRSPEENVLYEIAFDVDLGKYAGARYFYVDRDDATNVKQRIYLDSGFNPII